MSKTKILFFASNPESTEKLRLDEEARSIARKIRETDYRDSLEFITSWATRPTDLLDELNLHKPTVVHFSGHGSGEEGLILSDDQGNQKFVSADALKMLFSSVKDNIRLVVLNACYSEVQAKAISEVIDCVVGMNSEIGDQAAITFAEYFYNAIGYGRSVKEAFEQGKAALMLEGISEEHIPMLITRSGIDPSSVMLVQKEQRPQDLIDAYLALARDMLNANARIERAPPARREAIARYYQKISTTLNHAEKELRANQSPHGDCARMREYAEQLPKAIGDYVGAQTALDLSNRLLGAYRIEGLIMDLENLPNRDERLRDLGKAAAYFEVAADSLLASL
ncbi:MAG TPA: hypothetical protein DDW27_17965 [Bacteroidales bacterium]|nr:hypothetical protein [Bacteroidales bacterium]